MGWSRACVDIGACVHAAFRGAVRVLAQEFVHHSDTDGVFIAILWSTGTE